jgi:hypothetical protein
VASSDPKTLFGFLGPLLPTPAHLTEQYLPPPRARFFESGMNALLQTKQFCQAAELLAGAVTHSLRCCMRAAFCRAWYVLPLLLLHG